MNILGSDHYLLVKRDALGLLEGLAGTSMKIQHIRTFNASGVHNSSHTIPTIETTKMTLRH